MSKSVRISEEFHAFVKAHKRDDETMEETPLRFGSGRATYDAATAERGWL